MNSRRLYSIVLALTLLSGCASPRIDTIEEGGSLPIESTNTLGNSQIESRPEISAETYRLGEGDGIAIQVFDEADLTLETVVGASGAINYSYLGDIRVAGKSPVELEQEITELLKNGYLVNPSVNVRVTRYRQFYINGEVRTPGGYQYQPGLTLERAIALAGGLTDRASTRKMFVTKSESGISDDINVPMDFRVQPGDTITIKEGFF